MIEIIEWMQWSRLGNCVCIIIGTIAFIGFFHLLKYLDKKGNK